MEGNNNTETTNQNYADAEAIIDPSGAFEEAVDVSEIGIESRHVRDIEDRNINAAAAIVEEYHDEEDAIIIEERNAASYGDIMNIDDYDEHERPSSRVSFDREVEVLEFEDEQEQSEREEAEALETRKQNSKFPADCYSFLSLHGPLSNPRFFLFGLSVWIFQVTFEVLMMMRVISKYSSNEDTDNPRRESTFNFVPSNVSTLVRITQFVALLSYCAFADDSLKDIVRAVELFPRFDKATPGDKVNRLVLSCVLRLFQGVLATLVVLVLVVQTPDVIDIILNFTAVNFISNLDDIAFELAQWGKYGPTLKAEADRIEDLRVPDCVFRTHDHVRWRYTISAICAALMIVLTSVAMMQKSTRFWTTKRLRVQFKDGSLFEDYSGCYDLDPETTGWSVPRKGYNGFGENEASIGYCDQTKKWHLYETGEDESLDYVCNTTTAIAWSAKTYTFDIFSTFEETWYSTSGRPLELYFFDEEKSLDDVQCGSSLGDGICNKVFNEAEYDYDEGDCCYDTCDETQCGIGSLTKVFQTNISTGNGYPDCNDKNMKDITIRINDVFVPGGGSTSAGAGGPSGGDVEPREPLMILDCDGKNVIMASINQDMRNKTEVIKVADGANCIMLVKNTTVGNAGVLYVDFTVFHGDEKSVDKNPIVMVHGDSTVEEVSYFQRIPECYFTKLKDHIDISTIYTANEPSNKAVKWLMKDSRMFSKCERDEFLERYALATINFAAPIIQSNDEAMTTGNDQGLWITSARHCVWRVVGCTGNIVTELNYKALGDGTRVAGTLATEIGLLKNLTQIAIGFNRFMGSIPSQIDQMSGLTYFDIQENAFNGTIPAEIGALTKLKYLILHTNELSGSIPSQLGNISSLQTIWMWANVLTGSIPTEIGKLTLLDSFVVDSNQLTGPIPNTFGNLLNLEYLGFSYNNLTGTIPIELSKTALQSIVADANSLTGSVPLEILESNFTMLDLWGNRLTNLIPVDGSVICPNPTEIYPFNPGDHYCNCAANCLGSIIGPQNKCACEDGQSCCNAFLEIYTECIICEYGFENGNFFIPDEGRTCDIFGMDRSQNIMKYGTEERCEPERLIAEEKGCRCNTDPPDIVPCALCQAGLINPEFYIEEVDATCNDAQIFIMTNQQTYGDPSECQNINNYFSEQGCRCLEGSSAEQTIANQSTVDAVEDIPGATKCVICEFGLENPSFAVETPTGSTTCQDISTSFEQNIGQSECNEARKGMEEAGCVCRDDVAATTEEFGFECIICESGLQNPDFYLAETQSRCIDSVEFVRGNIEDYGTKSSCDTVRIGLLGFGCICNEDSPSGASEPLSSSIET